MKRPTWTGHMIQLNLRADVWHLVKRRYGGEAYAVVTCCGRLTRGRTTPVRWTGRKLCKRCVRWLLTYVWD